MTPPPVRPAVPPCGDDSGTGLFRKLLKRIHRRLRLPRARFLERVIDPRATTVLDLGSADLYFARRLQRLGFRVTCLDLSAAHTGVVRGSVLACPFPDRSFDTVVALEVVEHVPDPVRALREIRRLARRQFIISVPNEPWFSFWRFLTWEPEHLWAVGWPAVHHHLGKPRLERVLVLGRYRYFAYDLT